ncbi:hypothetical protein [Mycobacterium persicum]|uniref:hypothetical protein n=1 Tax=Mycobacterium persicum TaxID=1487726 RepID=UPI001153B568|nr:hypothetical protein [Mycobacterium persicum]
MVPCPRSGVCANAFSIQNLLRGRHDLVDGGPRRIRRVSIASYLDHMYFFDLLWQRLFRTQNVIYFSITGICNFCQSSAQVVDRVSTRIERICFDLVFLSFIKLGLLAPKISGDQVLSSLALVLRQNAPLSPQILD